MRKLDAILACLALVAVAGCTESTNVTVHEPGIYKGASDPLLSADSEERAAQLNERFRLGQRDR